MDITFKTEQGRFNYRVCGIIIHGEKILAMKNGRTPYYFLPGGRVRLGETVEEAVVRELREELEIDAKIARPLWFNQGFFNEDVTGEQFHEICLYFLMDISHTDLLSKGETFTLHEGTQRHSFEWLAFERLKEEYFYPVFLKEKIFDLPETLTIIENYD